MIGRDRLRELLDAVLAEDGAPAPRPLEAMAADAFTSPFHFSRLLTRGTGEPPVAMRRRVLLERAAWQLRHGVSIAEVAGQAGYGSVDGFSRAYGRAFGHPPSRPAARHWLPAPNGIHFHPPSSLWVNADEHMLDPVTEQLLRHDVDDTRALLERVRSLPESALWTPRLPGALVLAFDGPEESLGAVLEHLVWCKQIWLASIAGEDVPARDERPALTELVERHERTAARWLATVREIDARGGWGDRLIDALCDPPESFLLSGVVAHVLTFSAHRRQLVRLLLRLAGGEVDHGDPLDWQRNEEQA